uniref:Ion_trans domain-containing protein n=1 Tax=Mesocestoides corti TaxID=53468 RepID=A0A5K3G351_MESCO
MHVCPHGVGVGCGGDFVALLFAPSDGGDVGFGWCYVVAIFCFVFLFLCTFAMDYLDGLVPRLRPLWSRLICTKPSSCRSATARMAGRRAEQ